MQMVSFEPEQWKGIEPRGIHLGPLLDQISLQERLPLYRAAGPAFTLLTGEGEVVASGGVLLAHSGLGEAWVLTSGLVSECVTVFAGEVKRKLEELQHGNSLHRVQAMCEEGDDMSSRWLEWLGFRKEALLRQYLPSKRNVRLYVRLQ